MQHTLKAPMAGKVIQVNFREGEKVEEDDEGLVLEAMKMETPIFVPCDGVVQKINVKVGDSVDEDDVLAVIDAA
jgi:acetyl-CoA carboxylase biotin carboxyl carrier protein